MVIADADALGTALVNLLENALKYTTGEKRISVRASADGGGFVRFDVTDNGIGIPAGEQRRIFRRFYRVDQRLSRETAGEMKRRGPKPRLVEFAGVGHAPTLIAGGQVEVVRDFLLAGESASDEEPHRGTG